MIRSAIFVAVALLLVAANAQAVDYQQGLDVSRFQGNINWTSVKNDGIKFVFAKATEGVDFVDVNFHQNMAGASAAGVSIGPYHFGRLNSGETIPTDAIDEANDFVDAIQSYYQTPGLVLRPVLDYEQLPNDPVSPSVKAYTSKWIRDFSGVVQTRLGFRPIIYTCCGLGSSSFLEPDIAQHDLWVRKITGGNTFNAASPPTGSDLGIWSDFTFWQWSDVGSVGGISPVDRDAFKGTIEQLYAYIPNPPVPEPGSFMMTITGIASAFGVRKRRTRGKTRQSFPDFQPRAAQFGARSI